MRTVRFFLHYPKSLACRWLLIYLLMGVSGLAIAQAPADSVGVWEVFELKLKAQKDAGGAPNPYMAMDTGVSAQAYLVAHFRCIQGRGVGKTLDIRGFWDGGQKWKLRFAPPAPGTWTYITASEDPGLNGRRGRLIAHAWTDAALQENPLRRGFISAKQGGHHLQYADGTPFLWIGDTWWAWSDKHIRQATFDTLVANRCAKGFTVGQIFVPSTDFHGTSDHPDMAYLHHLESFIREANARGMVVSVSAVWGGKMPPTLQAESRRWWRYLTARLGAYQVIWMVASEYNMNDYGGADLTYWKRLGQLVKASDPYHRATSVHPTPPNWGGGVQGESAQWSTAEVLHGEPWLDFNQTQLGHGKFRNEMAPEVVSAAYRRQPSKPIIITEPWYEFVPGSAPAMDIRFAGWSGYLSGAAGITYGGGHVWWAYLSDNHDKPQKDFGGYPIDPDLQANTLDYPGAQSVGFMARYLSGLPWWTLVPHPELVLDYPAPYCRALPGKEYLVYLRYGGNCRVDLRATGHTALQYEWTDLVTLETRSGTKTGGALVRFESPNGYPGSLEYHDCVLHIWLADEGNRMRAVGH